MLDSQDFERARSYRTNMHPLEQINVPGTLERNSPELLLHRHADKTPVCSPRSTGKRAATRFRKAQQLLVSILNYNAPVHGLWLLSKAACTHKHTDSMRQYPIASALVQLAGAGLQTAESTKTCSVGSRSWYTSSSDVHVLSYRKKVKSGDPATNRCKAGSAHSTAGTHQHH